METTVTADEELSGRERRLAGGSGTVATTVARWQETWLSRTSTVPTWIGVGVIAAGFALIAFGWSRVAGLLAVPLQMPYLISAGFTGLGLISLGIGIVAVQAKRQETAARERQLDEIRDLVDRLNRHVSGEPGFGASDVTDGGGGTGGR